MFHKAMTARRDRILKLAACLNDLIADDFIEETNRQRQVPSFRCLERGPINSPEGEHMVAKRKFVDLEDNPDLADVARSVHRQDEPVVRRQSGHKLAALVPMTDAHESETDNSVRAECHKRLMELAGSMKGLVDDDILYEIYRSRSISPRPPVEP